MAFEAIFRLKGDDAEFSTTMDRAEQRVKKFENAGGSVIGALGKLAAAFYIARHAVNGLTSGMQEALDKAHKFALIAERTNMPVGQVAQLSELAEETGTSIESIGRGMLSLQKFADIGLSGTNHKVNELAERLKLTTTEMHILRDGGGNALALIADKLKNVNDEGERNAMISELMGKRGFEMINILSMTGEQIKSSMTEQVALSEHQVMVLNPIKSLVKDLGDTWTSVSANMIESLMPLVPTLTSIVLTIIDMARVVTSLFGKRALQSQLNDIDSLITPLEEKYNESEEGKERIKSIQDTGIDPKTGFKFSTVSGKATQIATIRREQPEMKPGEKREYDRLYQMRGFITDAMKEHDRREAQSHRMLTDMEDKANKLYYEYLSKTGRFAPKVAKAETSLGGESGVPNKAEKESAELAQRRVDRASLVGKEIAELEIANAKLEEILKKEATRFPGMPGFKSAEYIEAASQLETNRKKLEKAQKLERDRERADMEKDLLLELSQNAKLFDDQIAMDEARGESADSLHRRKMANYEQEMQFLQKMLEASIQSGASETDQRRIKEAIGKVEDKMSGEKLDWFKGQMGAGAPGGAESIQTIGGGGRVAFGGVRDILQAQLEVQQQIAANTAGGGGARAVQTPQYSGPVRNPHAR